MKTKIFEKLKQAYAPLGLGDEFLQAQAEALASSGIVTDENIDAVVNSQKAFLESVQKSNDKRATDAIKKAEQAASAKAAEAAKAAKEAEDALKQQLADLQKQIDDSKKTPVPPVPPKDGDDDFQKKFEAANAGTMAQMKAMQELLEKMQKESKSNSDEVTKLRKEKEDLERAQAAAKRQEGIIAKAKELNIPQYRIDEGFNIAADADETAINDYLTNVAGNIKKNSLPTNSHFAIQGKEVSKAETDDIAAKMV